MVKFVFPYCVYNTCSQFQRKFELKTYIAESLLFCIKFVLKALIIHYKQLIRC